MKKLKKNLSRAEKTKLMNIVSKTLESSTSKELKVDKEIFVKLLANELTDDDLIKLVNKYCKSQFEMIILLMDLEFVEVENKTNNEERKEGYYESNQTE